jgi:hypothetical protein
MEENLLKGRKRKYRVFVALRFIAQVITVSSTTPKPHKASQIKVNLRVQYPFV